MVHVEPAPQTFEAAVIDDAFAGNVCPAPSLNWVEVTVRFQPAPVPRGSIAWAGSVYVGVWSTPFSVRAKLGVPVDEAERVEPPVTVPVIAIAPARSAPARPARAIRRRATAARLRISKRTI